MQHDIQGSQGLRCTGAHCTYGMFVPTALCTHGTFVPLALVCQGWATVRRERCWEVVIPRFELLDPLPRSGWERLGGGVHNRSGDVSLVRLAFFANG